MMSCLLHTRIRQSCLLGKTVNRDANKYPEFAFFPLKAQGCLFMWIHHDHHPTDAHEVSSGDGVQTMRQLGFQDPSLNGYVNLDVTLAETQWLI